MQSRTLRFVISLFIAGLIGYYLGVTKITLDWAGYQPKVAIAGKEPPPAVTKADFSEMWEVLQRLQATYYDPTKIDSQKLVDGAISGMVDSLGDPYTVYLPSAQNDDFKEGMAGTFGGIGAELGMEEKQIIVVAPLAGSPAEKAGIKAGDAILKINDQITSGWAVNKAVENIRGLKGTEVTLMVLHKGQEKPQTIKIVRDTITIKSVTAWVKPVKDIPNITQSTLLHQQPEKKIAYIKLSQFGDKTNEEWTKAVNDITLSRQNGNEITGVVLDLRNNPGGYLTDAVFIASEFVESGTIVIQDDGKGKQTPLTVNKKGLLTDVPVFVLINEGSASASEIVAGALSDHKRATLVGDTSFGKGTIQAAEDLGKGAGLHVTIAKWLTPNGTWVHQKGLTPDIAVSYNPEEPTRDIQLEKTVEAMLQ